MAVDQLKSVILSLNEEEKKEFRVFAQRQRSKDHRRDLELFEIIITDPDKKPRLIINELYGNENREAYNMLRKRLIRQLTDFVTLKRMDEDETDASKVMSMLSLSQHLFSRNLHRIGWSYLLKAENLAQKSELFDLLDNVYNLQIEQWHPEFAPEIDSIVNNLRNNRVLAAEDEDVNILTTKIKHLLHKHKAGILDDELSSYIMLMFHESGVTETFSKRPKHLLKVLSILRIGVLADKDFLRFEPIIVEQYNQIEQNGGFDKRNMQVKIELLYMISHVLYRNRDFKGSLVYLKEMRQSIESQLKSFRDKYYPRYVLLYASVKSYLGFNNESIKLIEEYLAKEESRISVKYMLDLKLNLTVYYAQNEEFYKSNRILMEIHHSDKWCEKKMGREWVLRKNLVDVINLFERENYEIALSRIKAIERSFASLLETNMYARVKTFVGLIKYMINYPEQVTTPEFFQKVDGVLERLPTDREDLLAMAFYCWLKAKMQKESYYKVLVETVNDVTLKG
ncbi:MAG: hypothetical protein JKY54_15270 [Flavobacteriales bacterium]|nr:hypothetical protein [Flavobacteriales bacterium]